MNPTIHVGVSGFSYPAWKGKFYPKDARNEDLLLRYAQRLGSVEINSSFYGAPRQDTIKSWAERTNIGFRFAFKAPRLITHITKLGAGSADYAKRFSDSLGPLGPRLGPILFQLPPFIKLDMNLLERFLTETDPLADRVFEFRDKSWLGDSVFGAMQRHHVGFCIAETEEMEPRFEVTSSTAYFRLRKDEYNSVAMDSWAKKISKIASNAAQTYVFLRHDETGANALLAGRLAKNLAE